MMSLKIPSSLVADVITTANRQFAAMAPVIAKLQPTSVLDIGCGLAVIDIVLARNVPTIATLHLMDGDGTGRQLTGYGPAVKPWRNVALGADFVRANVPSTVEVIAHQADPDLSVTVDLILSSRSWGHHYPVETYVPLAQRCLVRGGMIVLDIRNRTDGVQVLQQAGFHKIAEIADPSRKCRRMAFMRNA